MQVFRGTIFCNTFGCENPGIVGCDNLLCTNVYCKNCCLVTKQIVTIKEIRRRGRSQARRLCQSCKLEQDAGIPIHW
jgi:hypothetical protein